MGHDHSQDWRPVPILGYRDAGVTAAFWRSLGFRVADASADETPYLIAVREGAELHFAADPGLDPGASPYRCYVARRLTSRCCTRSGRRTACRPREPARSRHRS